VQLAQTQQPGNQAQLRRGLCVRCHVHLHVVLLARCCCPVLSLLFTGCCASVAVRLLLLLLLLLLLVLLLLFLLLLGVLRGDNRGCLQVCYHNLCALRPRAAAAAACCWLGLQRAGQPVECRIKAP
jgi:hypothetical protein